MKKTYEERIQEREEALENLRVAWANFKKALKDCYNDVYRALKNGGDAKCHK